MNPFSPLKQKDYEGLLMTLIGLERENLSARLQIGIPYSWDTDNVGTWQFRRCVDTIAATILR